MSTQGRRAWAVEDPEGEYVVVWMNEAEAKKDTKAWSRFRNKAFRVVPVLITEVKEGSG